MGVTLKPIYPILAIAGALIGALIGIVTRPTFMGVQVPMDILTSSSRMDAPFKDELTSHLLASTGIGLLVGVIAAGAAYAFLTSNKTV